VVSLSDCQDKCFQTTGCSYYSFTSTTDKKAENCKLYDMCPAGKIGDPGTTTYNLEACQAPELQPGHEDVSEFFDFDESAVAFDKDLRCCCYERGKCVLELNSQLERFMQSGKGEGCRALNNDRSERVFKAWWISGECVVPTLKYDGTPLKYLGELKAAREQYEEMMEVVDEQVKKSKFNMNIEKIGSAVTDGIDAAKSYLNETGDLLMGNVERREDQAKVSRKTLEENSAIVDKTSYFTDKDDVTKAHSTVDTEIGELRCCCDGPKSCELHEQASLDRLVATKKGSWHVWGEVGCGELDSGSEKWHSWHYQKWISGSRARGKCWVREDDILLPLLEADEGYSTYKDSVATLIERMKEDGMREGVVGVDNGDGILGKNSEEFIEGIKGLNAEQWAAKKAESLLERS